MFIAGEKDFEIVGRGALEKVGQRRRRRGIFAGHILVCFGVGKSFQGKRVDRIEVSRLERELTDGTRDQQSTENERCLGYNSDIELVFRDCGELDAGEIVVRREHKPTSVELMVQCRDRYA